MKINAVVILYNPQPNIFNNIETYLPYISTLYVYDNSTFSSFEYTKFSSSNKIQYYHNGENQGISVCLNKAVNKAISDQADFLLTMDQDSFFEKKLCQQYFNCVNNLQEKDSIAMIGVEFSKGHSLLEKCETLGVDFLITSGSLVNLKVINKVGLFDENLFIDEVDNEFCYRAILSNKRIIKCVNIFINHSIGNSSNHRSLKTGKITPRALHSPIRLYYMTRNYFYVNNKYKSHFKLERKRAKHSLIISIKNNLLYNSDKLRHIKNIVKGYIHYKQNKMGK